MLLELQKGVIYGPINSRRLGQSLGINILPANVKTCPFNCVYCHYGWTKFHQIRAPINKKFPSSKAVYNALKEALISLSFSPAYITFSGNGEPTLHPDFPQIVEEVISVRNKFAPQTKTAILSNSTLITDKTVRKAVKKLDVKIMKLDCGTPDVFLRYNQPCQGVSLDDITRGLMELTVVNIQTLISAGKSGNLKSDSIYTWIEKLRRIKPLEVQLCNLYRDYPAKCLKPASRENINWIRKLVQKAGISINIY